MKKIIGIIACLATAAAIGAYFFVVPEFEKKQAAQVEAFIDQLPGDLKAESIKTRFFGSQLEILGLKGTLTDFYGGEMKIDAKSITISGVNMTPGQGIVDLVDEAVFEDLKLVNPITPTDALSVEPGPESAVQVITQEFKKMTVKGLRGDYAALQSAVASGSRSDVLDCLATKFSVAQTSSSEYSYQMPWVAGPIQLSIKSILVKDSSMLKSGHNTLKGIVFSIDGFEDVSVGSLTMESGQIPNVYRILMKSAESHSGIDDFMNDFVETLATADEKNALVVKGMVLKDLKINRLTLEPVTIAELNFECSWFKDNWNSRYGVRKMILPISLYQGLGSEFAQFAKTHNKDLNVDAVVDFAVRSDDGKNPVLTVNRAFIEDKSLASADLSFTASTDDFEKVEMATDILLTKARLSLEDKGLIDTLAANWKPGLTMEVAPENINDPAHIRASVADENATAARLYLPGSMAKIIAGWIELIKAPGTLTMSYEGKPERPFMFGANRFFDKLPLEDVTVEYTPAK